MQINVQASFLKCPEKSYIRYNEIQGTKANSETKTTLENLRKVDMKY